jgi:hypothetical protein
MTARLAEFRTKVAKQVDTVGEIVERVLKIHFKGTVISIRKLFSTCYKTRHACN